MTEVKTRGELEIDIIIDCHTKPFAFPSISADIIIASTITRYNS